MDQQPVSSVSFGVLGPVVAWDGDGERLDLKGPWHREVLARLIAARGRVVPVGTLVDDLWVAAPAGAVGAVRTFVGALRQALEPDRPPRTPATLLVTEGPGYALRTDAVDAWRFEAALSSDEPAELEAALGVVARPGLCRLRLCGLGPGGALAAGRAAAAGGRAPGLGAPGARAGRGGRRGPRRARRRASLARGRLAPARAGALLAWAARPTPSRSCAAPVRCW